MIAITCFLIGSVFIHVVENNTSECIYTFFNTIIYRVVLLDIGLLLIGCGFFIEFYMSFKPIEIK